MGLGEILLKCHYVCCQFFAHLPFCALRVGALKTLYHPHAASRHVGGERWGMTCAQPSFRNKRRGRYDEALNSWIPTLRVCNPTPAPQCRRNLCREKNGRSAHFFFLFSSWWWLSSCTSPGKRSAASSWHQWYSSGSAPS